ncbi:Pleiotropic drug resistance protein TUR2, partial [Mucuna pruriens]
MNEFGTPMSNQNDLRIGEMSIRKTLAFSERIRIGPSSQREKEANIKPDPYIDAYM